MSTLKVWNSQEHSADDALNLPEGSYAANFGFYVEQSVTPEYVYKAASALIESGQAVKCFSQAGVIVKAQELNVAFTDWAPLVVF